MSSYPASVSTLFAADRVLVPVYELSILRSSIKDIVEDVVMQGSKMCILNSSVFHTRLDEVVVTFMRYAPIPE